MADNKKYYYMRLKENFFETESMIILESMTDGHLYSNILLKLYLRSLKAEGKLMFNDRIPYNPTVLAQITRHNVGVVEKAIDIFKELGLIEVLDSGAIYVLDIQEFIGKTSTEADRIRAYRKRISEEKKSTVQMYDKCTPELELEIEKELDIEIERDTEKTPPLNYQGIVDSYNNTCKTLPKVIKISEPRKRAIRARLKTYSQEDLEQVFTLANESDFLKGKNNKGWSANFDWLINEANMVKVLEGNYKNSKGIGKQTFDDFVDVGKEWLSEREGIFDDSSGDKSDLPKF